MKRLLTRRPTPAIAAVLTLLLIAAYALSGLVWLGRAAVDLLRTLWDEVQETWTEAR